MVLDTVWWFLATNNLRFFLSLNTLYYWPYQEYIRDADNINEEGEWDISVGAYAYSKISNSVDFAQPHFDFPFATLCPYTTYLLGDFAVTHRAEYFADNDEAEAARISMADLLIETSDRWREMAWF